MKKTTSAFAVTFALAAVYAVFTSRVALTALALAGGRSSALIGTVFVLVVNSVLALLLGVFCGLSPLTRCWGILPAPILLVTVYRLIAGTLSPLVWLTALYMLALSVLGAECAAVGDLAARLAKRVRTKS